MTRSLLADAFGHHVWATRRLIDACQALEGGQVEATATGTYGSILDTLRHLVGADASYLNVLSGGTFPRVPDAEEASMDLAGLRAEMDTHGGAWAAVLAQDPDPDAVLVRHRDDGSESCAPAGIRLAQALNHGTDHRSQVCTILTSLGVQPPDIDVWDYAWADGRLVEVPAPA